MTATMVTPRKPGPLARRLTEARLARGLSKSELARRAGVDPSYVTRVESGSIEEPAPGRLRRLADVLGVPLEALIEGPRDPADEALIRRVFRGDARQVEDFLDFAGRLPEAERKLAVEAVLDAVEWAKLRIERGLQYDDLVRRRAAGLTPAANTPD